MKITSVQRLTRWVTLRSKHPRIWVQPTQFQNLSEIFKIDFPGNRMKILISPESVCFTEPVPNFWYRKIAHIKKLCPFLIPEFNLRINLIFQACHEQNGLCSNLLCPDGELVPDLCWGGGLRRCCVPNAIQGDVYWNKFNEYNLTKRYGHPYGQGSLKSKKDLSSCIKFKSLFLTFNKILSHCFRLLSRWIRLSWNNKRKRLVLYSFNGTNSTKPGNT